MGLVESVEFDEQTEEISSYYSMSSIASLSKYRVRLTDGSEFYSSQIKVENTSIYLDDNVYEVYEGSLWKNEVYEGGLWKKSNTPAAEQLLTKVPALGIYVNCPVCTKWASLWYTIQSLNDEHEWSREAIAEWLEVLDLDIRFKIGELNEQD